MADWLSGAGCEMVAMESTGSYWKPLYNVLESAGMPAMVVNAQHVRNVPGRKTDVRDAEWLADLLQHGLLKASFIPGREQRELRDLTRYRKSLIEERSRELNRLQKVLETANIKISSVLTDTNGKSLRRLLEKIAANEAPDAGETARLIHQSLLPKLNDIMLAMDGITTPLQRALLSQILGHIDELERRIASLDELVERYMAEYAEALAAIDQIPGVGTRSAQVILAEIGMDMSRFPSAEHLCSWAGIAPGNHQSAGKRKSGKTNKGNKTLKSMLIQCAKSAKRVKGSYFSAQFNRISARRGKNRAAVAVAHSILTVIYHILKERVPYCDLGSDYYDSIHREHKINGYLKRFQALGWTPEMPVTA